MRRHTQTVYAEVLADLRRRLAVRLGQKFVKYHDQFICSMALTTARMILRQSPALDLRRREAWMQYLVEELLPLIPWAVAGGPGWDQVKDNPPKPSGWALAQVEASAP
jgi:hypothetical protein